MEIVIAAVLLGLIPAIIAQKKGEVFIIWWIYGSLLFIVALVHAILMKPNKQAIEQDKISNGMRKCQYCAEFIMQEAIKCKHCGSDVPQLKENKIVAPIRLLLPRDVYITRRDAEPEVNKDTAAEIAKWMVATLPGKSSVEVMRTYREKISTYKGMLPKKLRNEFEETISQLIQKEVAGSNEPS